MKLHLNNTDFIDTDQPLDVSMSLHNGPKPVLAWYCDPIKIEPVMTDNFIGDVNQGGSVNFRNIFLNPHGNGTHTECVGHISKENYSINKCLDTFHFEAVLISVTPTKQGNVEMNCMDNIITKKNLELACVNFSNELNDAKAILIRTLPNLLNKTSTDYSNTNPTYFTKEAIEYINALNIDHLLVDLPSIDREEDGGELIGHHTFWDYPNNTQEHKTITELIFVSDDIKDERYILNIQITSLENDASPSKIVLYEVKKD